MARALRDTPWPVLLLLASYLCPTELSVFVGGARLPMHRALLLVLIVPAAFTALLGSKRIAPKAFDLAVLALAVWNVVAYIHHHGSGDGLQTGGALALDAFGSFIVARAFVRDERALRGTAGALLLTVGVAGIIAIPETLLGRIFLHEILREATGNVHPVGIETRLGLTRAFGVFDHPIHMGTFCAATLAFAVYGARADFGAVGRGLVIVISALTSLSSAPMLSLALQLGMIGYERITRGIKGRVYIAVAGICAVFLAISAVATRSPFAIIATGFTLDSWTGYYRLMIWHHGLENVWANPLFGLGLNDWERPLWMVSSTIDSFWLVLTIRTGLPAVVLLIAAMILIGRGVGRRIRRADRDRRQLATGWMISLVTLCLVGCTVHYWNVPYAYFFFFLGLGACIADPLRSRAEAPVARPVALEAPRLRWTMPDTGPALAAERGNPSGGTIDWGFGPPRWPVPVGAAGSSEAGALRRPVRRPG